MREIIVILVIFAFYTFQSWLYKNKCFDKVHFGLKFALNGIFEGEGTELIESISNKKLMPLWWLSTQFKVSRKLRFTETEDINRGVDNYRRDFYSVLPYERVIKAFKLTGDKRGFYTISQVELHTGDLFGINKIIAVSEEEASLYVYPRLITPQELSINFKGLTGEILTKRNIIEDPFQIRSIREYNHYDSMKVINWSATARTLDIKVNQFDFTASQEVMIFLNIEKYNAWDSEGIIEEGIRLAASLITQYLKLGMKVGLESNGCDLITGKPVNIPGLSGTDQEINFYKSLARLDTEKLSQPLIEMLEEFRIKQNKAPIWIVISHFYSNKLEEQVMVLRSQGYEVKWILPKESGARVDLSYNKDLFIWDVKEA